MRILVTGGAGYIGSHTCVELLDAGHELVVVDNLSNSKATSLERVKALTGRSVEFVEADLLQPQRVAPIFQAAPIDAVIHFAALKAVGESVQKPLEYYRNNVAGTIQLLQLMRDHGCKTLVYSSSCTVYGEPQRVPISEDHPTSGAESPYGWTKLMTEQVMRDLSASDPEWNITLLRYFNPVGAHPSGTMGEDPSGIPSNLMPFITQVAVGRLERLSVFGDDYPTRDGTAIRDYIHVVDLAKAHLAAVARNSSPGIHVYNLGTGEGSTVLEVIAAFESATGKQIPIKMAPRREGDIVAAYANPTKAEQALGWKAQKNLQDMCRDSWHWQEKNPQGYE